MDNGKQNVFDYLEWRGDLSFDCSAFNEVDSLILSIFTYINFSFLDPGRAVTLSEASEKLHAQPDEIKLKGPGYIILRVLILFARAAKSERFKKVVLTGYTNRIDEEKEMQFSAITFLLPDHTGVIAFRGTDSSLVGWKESLNMSFISGVPAQIEAANYASTVMDSFSIPFRITGHSKGGNLAVWAASHLSEDRKENLLAVYSNDGPGFKDDFLKSDIYKEIREKVHSFVPESSIVGVLMNHDDYRTIRSSEASLLQHDPFSWIVRRTHFIYNDTRSESGKQMDKMLNNWIRSMSSADRESFVENVFDLLESSNAKTLEDLDRDKLKTFLSMQKTFMEMGNEKQTQLLTSLAKLFFNEDYMKKDNQPD